MCSCQVPHFVEASGYYNPKIAPKKTRLGTGERIILAIGTATAEIYTAFGYPQILRWGGWVFPFCRAKSGFWGPRPLQTEEPAKNVARCFLYKFRAAQKVVAMMDLEKIKWAAIKTLQEEFS